MLVEGYLLLPPLEQNLRNGKVARNISQMGVESEPTAAAVELALPVTVLQIKPMPGYDRDVSCDEPWPLSSGHRSTESVDLAETNAIGELLIEGAHEDAMPLDHPLCRAAVVTCPMTLPEHRAYGPYAAIAVRWSAPPKAMVLSGDPLSLEQQPDALHEREKGSRALPVWRMSLVQEHRRV